MVVVQFFVNGFRNDGNIQRTFTQTIAPGEAMTFTSYVLTLTGAGTPDSTEVDAVVVRLTTKGNPS